MKRVAVVGWYSHGNLGDEAFRPAINHLWGSRASFEFLDEVPEDVNDYDALVFGGGSFFDKPIPSRVPPLEVKIPIAFLGVGIHDDAHGAREWLSNASVVVARNVPPASVRDAVSDRLLLAPDLIFARPWEPPSAPSGGVLVLGNCFAVAGRASAHWRAAAWQWFAAEFAAALDGQPVTFYPMGMSRHWENDDRLFGAAIVAQMGDRSQVSCVTAEEPSEEGLVAAISDASLVISLRFHGALLAAIHERAFVGISFHDKMRTFFVDRGLANYCNFYGFTREALARAEISQPGVRQLRQMREDGYGAWSDLRDTVAARLSL